MEGRLKYYTLFFVDETHYTQNRNGINGPLDEQIRTFVLCCRQLNAAIAHFDPEHELVVITNNEAAIKSVAPELRTQVIPFELSIPSTVKAWSNHYKFELFKWLGTKGAEYSIVLDADMTCINPMPVNLRLCLKKNIPIYYDISDQIYPAYGRERVITDKDKLSDIGSIGLWAGGEFIGGDGAFFAELYKRITRINETYFKVFAELRHQGNETAIGVAIEEMLRSGTYICDAGKLGIIGRFWSAPPVHVQRPFAAYLDNFFLHLPFDKGILSECHSPETFVRAYQRYLARKRNIVRRGFRRLKRIVMSR